MIALIDDIYYSDDYISLYLKDDEELFGFEYKDGEKIFINKTIKRPILNIGNTFINDGFFDLETAYGYGGFYTNSNDLQFVQRAMEEYKQKCRTENIIAEFIRFHPFNDFSLQYSNFLDFNLYDRDVVVKKITDNTIQSYVSKVRNIIKKANEKVQILESDNITKFIELYNATMKKNNADKFYFFQDKYYQNLLKNQYIRLYEVKYNNEIIAMGFFMFSNDLAHYHLSANTSLSYKLNANYSLLNKMFEIANDLNINYFLLGGGTTSFDDDSLFKFKKKFSKEIKPFYISGKIYNKKFYDKYNKIWQEQSKEDMKYFLKYRLEIK